MPKPFTPTAGAPISPLDPTYIPFTTADPTAANLKIEDFPQKEPRQYRNILKKLQGKIEVGDKILPEAFAYAQTDTNEFQVDQFIVTSPGPPTTLQVGDGGVRAIAIDWIKPVDEGNAGTIKDYIIEYSINFEDDGENVNIMQKAESTFTSFGSLKIGNIGLLQFRVRAVNEKSQGGPSNVVIITVD